MNSEFDRPRARGKPNKLQMVVSGTIVAATLLRLLSQDSGAVLWVNIFLLVLGVVGFVVAALIPRVFERKQ